MPLGSRILPVLLALGTAWLLTGPVAADKDDAERIDKLIEQLGSGSFQEREAATKALDAIGAPALEKLRKAADSDDAEVKRRAADLATRIEKRADAGRILAAKRVHLVYKDTPFKEALEDFKKKSGYDLALNDPDNKLADRKVTLDTGDTTFWEAFDKFCDAAGVQQITQQDMMQQMMQQMMQRQQAMMEQMKKAPPPVPPAKKPAEKEAPARPEPKKDEKPAAAPKPDGAAKAEEERAAVAKERAAREVAMARLQVALAQAAAQQPPAAARGAIMIGPSSMGMPSLAPNQVMLKDGKRKPLPTHYAGSVRVRALEPMPAPPGQETPHVVNLQASTEPRLQVLSAVLARLTKAVDENGQSLSQIEPTDNGEGPVVGPLGARRMILRAGPLDNMPGMMGGPGTVTIPFKKGDKPSKTLKELSGTLTIQALDTPEALIAVENVLKAGGTTTKGKTGGQLKVVEVSKTEEGHVKLQVELDLPPDVTPAGRPGFAGVMTAPAIRFNVALPPPPAAAVPPAAPLKDKPAEKPKEAPAKQANAPAKEQVKDKPAAAQPPAPPVAVPAIGVAARAAEAPLGPRAAGARYPGNSFNGLTLVDDKGKSLPILHVTANSRVAAGKVETTYEMTFEVKKDQAAPAKLLFSGSRTVTFEVPFVLKDVPLK